MLVGLLAIAWGVARWLAAEPGSSSGPRRPASHATARPDPAGTADSDVLEVREPAAALSADPRTDAEPHASAAPPRCPDLDALLEDLARQLEGAQLRIVQEWDPRVAASGASLDTHCADLLVERAGSPAEAPSRRLAALSLLRARPGRSKGGTLSEGARSLLWRAFDTSQPSPVPVRTGLEPSLNPHRDSIARVAGACLAVLGDAGDLARLVDGLDAGGGRELAAARSLGYARSPEAARALLERLADPARRTTAPGMALLAMLDAPDPPALDPALVRLAAQALHERWQRLNPGSAEVGWVDFLLSRLDPALRAERWAQLLERGAVLPRQMGLATAACIRHGSPEALARVERLLVEGSDEARLATASAVLRHAEEGSSSDLRTGAVEVLSRIARTSPEADLRVKALMASIGHQDSGTVSLASEALARDEDPSVRHAAAVCLGKVAAHAPAIRAQLERAAARDSDERVRQAAGQALR